MVLDDVRPGGAYRLRDDHHLGNGWTRPDSSQTSGTRCPGFSSLQFCDAPLDAVSLARLDLARPYSALSGFLLGRMCLGRSRVR